MGLGVNIESNGGAIGTKRSGMTLLLGPSAICNWLGLLPPSADADFWARISTEPFDPRHILCVREPSSWFHLGCCYRIPITHVGACIMATLLPQNGKIVSEDNGFQAVQRITHF